MAVRKLLQNLDCQGVQLLNSPTIITPTIASFANANHQHVNAAGGGLLAETSLTLTDITTNNATTGRHGFCPKFPGHDAGTALTFLADDGGFWPSALSILTAGTAVSSTTMDFVASLDTTYTQYLIVIDGMRPTTDAVNFWLRVSTDEGATWKAGASDYAWVNRDWLINSGPTSSDSTASAQIEMMQNMDNNHRLGNASSEHSQWRIWISHPANSGKICQIAWDGVWQGSGSTTYPAGRTQGMGYYKTVAAINGIRLMMSSGTIAEGYFRLYGVG